MESQQSITPPIASAAQDSPEERTAFRVLLDRVFEGVPGAAEKLQLEYGAHIIRVVRRRLPRQLRPKFDSLDFVQDVWASFFRGSGRDFQGPEHLIAFLTRVAQNKVTDATAGCHATKRDSRREEPLAPEIDGQNEQKLFAREATPSQAAIGQELWAQMLEGQPPAYRQVLVMLRDGQSQTEVAAALNLHRKTVQRILSRALQSTGHDLH
jgi:RNA polymerase sigma factor (sigma-70 family)